MSINGEGKQTHCLGFRVNKLMRQCFRVKQTIIVLLSKTMKIGVLLMGLIIKLL